MQKSNGSSELSEADLSSELTVTLMSFLAPLFAEAIMPKLLALRANCPSPLFEELEKFLKLLASKRQVGIEPEASTSPQKPEPEEDIEWPICPARQNVLIKRAAERSTPEELKSQLDKSKKTVAMLESHRNALILKNANLQKIVRKFHSAAIMSESRNLDWDMMNQSSSLQLLQSWRGKTFEAIEYSKSIEVNQ